MWTAPSHALPAPAPTPQARFPEEAAAGKSLDAIAAAACRHYVVRRELRPAQPRGRPGLGGAQAGPRAQGPGLGGGLR
jgi:hypothetical protein